MSPTNLSRRAILAGAASVPALALPAAAAVALPAVVEPAAPAPAAAVVEVPNPDAALIALGEQLKVASAKAAKLNRVSSRLHDACLEASRYADYPDRLGNPEAKRAFHAMSKTNGYSEAADKWNDACELQNKLARAALKIPSNGRVGDGIHAAAAMALNDDYISSEYAPEAQELLQEMSARAGFPVPAKIARKLGRKAVAAPKAKPDPILAVIEEHRRAWDDLGECSELDKAESRGDKEAGRKLNRLHKAVDDANANLIDIAPSTIAGAAALLTYAADFVAEGEGANGGWPDGEAWISRRKYPWEVILHRNLAKALQTLAVQS
jgi:hypothetical protein